MNVVTWVWGTLPSMIAGGIVLQPGCCTNLALIEKHLALTLRETENSLAQTLVGTSREERSA